MLRIIFIPLLLVLFMSCKNDKQHEEAEGNDSAISNKEMAVNNKAAIDIPDSAFIDLKEFSDDFIYEMRYATDNNFLNKKMYDCDNCLVRYEVARALLKAAEKLSSQNLKIKFYDCFRPVEVQRKMWEIMPDDRYVANPNTTGSVHNRGAAVDITLVDKLGRELNMGTDFDHFDKEAHHSYTDLPDTVLKNRQLLKTTMESAGFDAIKTEWWHYNFGGRAKYGISDQELCE
jgi:D-alanyl-D-alanine dipeptidase